MTAQWVWRTTLSETLPISAHALSRRDDEAWERFTGVERRHLEDRCAGHLARLPEGALPGESAEELRLLA
jgi:hypothetical protein